MERKNEGVVNEKRLFHGSMDTKPSKIYTSEQGFDFCYSSYGLLGMGTYFTEKASYSHKYAHHFFDDIKQLLLARVLTGETYRCLPCSTLKKLPNEIPTSNDKGDELYEKLMIATLLYIVYDYAQCIECSNFYCVFLHGQFAYTFAYISKTTRSRNFKHRKWPWK